MSRRGITLERRQRCAIHNRCTFPRQFLSIEQEAREGLGIVRDLIYNDGLKQSRTRFMGRRISWTGLDGNALALAKVCRNVAGDKAETQRPRSEDRKKPEIRIPKTGKARSSRPGFGVQISGFGLWGFGLRIWDALTIKAGR
jgi:hypothetical protein